MILEDEYKHFDIDIDEWRKPKPFGISGCFRLCNEAQFMVEAVESHLPYLDEALLVVQPSTDGTVELARSLQRKHPDKVRVIEYPVNVYFIDKPEFHTVPDNSIYSFVYLSNYALSQCKYQWVAKTEGDVICLSSFNNIVDRITPESKPMYYGRVILNVAGENIDKFSATNPRNGGWDECVLYNTPDLGYFVKRDKWEVLEWRGESVCMGWSALHMKRCKAGKTDGWNGEVYVDWIPDNVKSVLRNFNAQNGYPGIDSPLGEPCLFEDTVVKQW